MRIHVAAVLGGCVWVMSASWASAHSPEASAPQSQGAVAPSDAGDLVVHMHGFENDQGYAMVAVHQSSKTFLKRTAPYLAERAIIKDGKAQWTFKNVPFGQYSVAVFHDENANFDLDATWIGIPKEAYGFSNNARRKYGPPKYKDTVFKLTSPRVELTVGVAHAMKDPDSFKPPAGMSVQKMMELSH